MHMKELIYVCVSMYAYTCDHLFLREKLKYVCYRWWKGYAKETCSNYIRV